jgi:hypothetical protein
MAYRETGNGADDGVSQGTSAGKTVSAVGTCHNPQKGGAPQMFQDGMLHSEPPGKGQAPSGTPTPFIMGTGDSQAYGPRGRGPVNEGHGDTSEGP